MDLSQVKMVVTDMDGTLLNNKHQVSNRFFEQFKQLKEKGILFVAASGRQYSSIIDKLHSIKKEIIVVAENGGFVMKNDNEVFSTPLNQRAKNEILDTIANLENVNPVLCSKTKAYLLNDSSGFVHRLKEFYNEYEILEDLKSHSGEILKIAIYHPEDSEKYIYPAVKHFNENLKVKVSGQNWVDLSENDANKGYAIEKLQEQYNISPDETMVFGDYNNDLEMIGKAKYSFAMANAHPNVIEAANYKTKSNEEYGVEEILEQLLLS